MKTPPASGRGDMSVIQLSDESFQAQGTFLETVSRVFVLYSFYIVQKELRLRCDFYFQFAEESSTRVEFTSAGSIGPSFFASLHDILHRPLIA